MKYYCPVCQHTLSRYESRDENGYIEDIWLECPSCENRGVIPNADEPEDGEDDENLPY